MSDPFIGEIRMFAGNFAPTGWAFCNGQLLAIQSNTALFSLLGTTYGGNGQTTFGLPNLQGRVPMHWGQGQGLTPRVLGEQDGTETVTLLVNQMPAHTHSLNANSAPAASTSPVGGTLADTSTSGPNGEPINIYNNTVNTTMNPASIGASGGSQPHNNMQPSLCVSFIIALEGIYPSRP